MCGIRNCGCIALIIGIVLGIIVGVLFYLGTITAATITAPIIIALIVAGVVLLFLTILLGISELREYTKRETCLCANSPGLVVSSIITIVVATASFAVTLTAGSIANAILIGIGATTFFVTLILLACWLICICQRNCQTIRD